jgi:integrase
MFGMAVTQKKDGRWAVVHYIEGRQRWRYFGRGAEGQKAANDFNAALKTDGKLRDYKPASTYSPTINALTDAYLTAKKGTMPAVSMQNLLYKLEAVILPRLGHIQAMRLTPEALDRYIADRSAHVKMTTVHRELSDLMAILNWSVRRRLLPRNPVAGYDKPKRDDTQISPPTVAEVRKIFKHSAEHLRRAISISFYTGLRPGNSELYGLTWDDVNIDDGVIYITSARKGGLRSRAVPLHPAFVEMLNKWRKQDNIDQKKGKKPQFLVNYRGKPVKSIKTAWRNAKDRAGIRRRLRPYDLRHGFATGALEAGADLKAVSEILGHSRTDTTTRIYQHTSPALQRAAIGNLPDIDTDD